MNGEKQYEGLRILIVEDNYFIATDLAMHLEEGGAEVIGPARTVREALALIDAQQPIDAASLDVNLGEGERVFPVADALQARGIPFVFSTGYDTREIPESYQAPRVQKPIEAEILSHQLIRLTNRDASGDPRGSTR